ncbi:hypothetical protein [Mesorhizobium sp. NBSH29]|uniref:hypothetical protein n=1 Tax=Mesorhizobium sp. NBSH29 TaxID=2654249 RepID=UPI00189644DD|nr:hypothetical protein [Mesorhizobium sp. NBSH29]
MASSGDGSFDEPGEGKGELQAPDVPVALKDITGGQPGLIPASGLEEDLRAELPLWNNSDPSPGFPETLLCYWDDAKIDEKQWVAPIPPPELFFRIPKRFLDEGEHRVRYDVFQSINDTITPSEDFVVTIDRTTPVLANPNHLIFPENIKDKGVTIEYLSSNGDVLETRVPDYDAVMPGDVIGYYWDMYPGERYLAGSKTVVVDDIASPIIVALTGDMIRERGNGTAHAYYDVTDRAGNRSELSDEVQLGVKAEVVPRDLPWPGIENASGTGATVTLDPTRALAGSTVVVPAGADLRPGDELSVQWGKPGTVGAYRVDKPTDADPFRFLVPKDQIAAHMGKILPVYYTVTEPDGDSHLSLERNLRMSVIPTSRYPIIQCEDRSGGMLMLSQVPDAGARLKLAPWVLMTTDQLITVRVNGLDLDSAPTEFTALDMYRVTEAELTVGIGAQEDVRVPKAFLANLRRHFQLTLSVWVSFDLGETWPSAPNFPLCRLDLVD